MGEYVSRMPGGVDDVCIICGHPFMAHQFVWGKRDIGRTTERIVLSKMWCHVSPQYQKHWRAIAFTETAHG